jgi:hypothetical protein
MRSIYLCLNAHKEQARGQDWILVEFIEGSHKHTIDSKLGV